MQKFSISTCVESVVQIVPLHLDNLQLTMHLLIVEEDQQEAASGMDVWGVLNWKTTIGATTSVVFSSYDKTLPIVVQLPPLRPHSGGLDNDYDRFFNCVQQLTAE